MTQYLIERQVQMANDSLQGIKKKNQNMQTLCMYDSRRPHLDKYSDLLSHSPAVEKPDCKEAQQQMKYFNPWSNFSGELVNNFSRNINHSEKSTSCQKQRDQSRDKDTMCPLCFLRDMSGLTQEQPSVTSVTDQLWRRSTERFYSTPKFHVFYLTALNQHMIRQDARKQQKHLQGKEKGEETK